MIAGVITVGMVANALLCDRGRSHVVLPESKEKRHLVNICEVGGTIAD